MITSKGHNRILTKAPSCDADIWDYLSKARRIFMNPIKSVRYAKKRFWRAVRREEKADIQSQQQE